MSGTHHISEQVLEDNGQDLRAFFSSSTKQQPESKKDTNKQNERARYRSVVYAHSHAICTSVIRYSWEKASKSSWLRYLLISVTIC